VCERHEHGTPDCVAQSDRQEVYDCYCTRTLTDTSSRASAFTDTVPVVLLQHFYQPGEALGLLVLSEIKSNQIKSNHIILLLLVAVSHAWAVAAELDGVHVEARLSVSRGLSRLEILLIKGR